MKKLSQEEVIDRCKKVHGDKYDYSKVSYINARTRITVICKKHGEFKTFLSVHAIQGSNCPTCSEITTEEFIAKANKRHNFKYDYSKSIYTGAVNKVIVTCKTHGDFLVQAHGHVRLTGCKQCVVDANTNNTEYFIKKSSEKHNNKYDYSLSKYTKGKNLLEIICPIHGVFEQSGAGHMSGRCCPQCACGGFRYNSPGTLYILGSNTQEITKVGITNNITKRLSDLRSSSQQDLYIIKLYNFDCGKEAYICEKEILSYLRQKYDNVDSKFDGYSETFKFVNNSDLLNIADRVTQDYGLMI